MVPTFASLPVCDGSLLVAIEALLAVVAEAALGLVAALPAHPAARIARQLVQLHVEAAVPRVKIAVAC